MRILGIDPGTSRIGFGLIETEGGLKLLDYGTIEAKEKNLPGKIANATSQLKALLKKSNPDLVALEKLFFSRNRKTAISVAQARGALLAGVMEHGVELCEFSPTEVKSRVTGYGLADKQGVAKMVKAILKLDTLTGYDDASDAIAIAIAAANHRRFLTRTKAQL